MITLIEAKSYKCLRYVRQPLGHFHILVGPNASGKSTFLDVLALLGDMLRLDVEEAIRRRARSVTELAWRGESKSFELAVELSLPRPVYEYSTARYEVRVGTDGDEGVALLVENLWLVRNGLQTKRFPPEHSTLFPTDLPPPPAIVTPPGKHTPAGYRKVLSRNPEGRVYVRSETTDWNFSLRPPRARAGLALVPEDEDRYLLIETSTGMRLPSWGLSDGTLRFLALTLLPYLPEPAGIYLIEEPENGIHPRAIEAVYQSLSSVYKGQVLCATHSPILLNLASADSLLCFARTDGGATDIVRGDMHPRLKEWRETVTLGDLLASGVLG